MNSVSALSSGAYTTTLLVMVDRLKGGRRAPRPRLGWIYHHDGVYDRKWTLPVYYTLVCGTLHYLGWTHSPGTAFTLPITGYTEQYEGRVVHYHCLALGVCQLMKRGGAWTTTVDNDSQHPMSDNELLQISNFERQRHRQSTSESRQHANKFTIRTNDQQQRL
jgi:hypothetical protein